MFSCNKKKINVVFIYNRTIFIDSLSSRWNVKFEKILWKKNQWLNLKQQDSLKEILSKFSMLNTFNY